MNTLSEILEAIANDKPQKLILSKPVKDNDYKKICYEKKERGYQISRYTQKQAFHENIAEDNLGEALFADFEKSFLQLNAFTEKAEHMVMVSRKGKVSYKKHGSSVMQEKPQGHNREKQYILQEGDTSSPLVDMGIFTKEGKIVRSMYDKFRQINRFIEIIDDEVKHFSGEKIHVIDFGCGKSYLTFVLYYYLTKVRGLQAEIIGLDLKEDVIARCNDTAKKYGYEGLSFQMGDINGYKTQKPVDMVVTLHACDCATDYALYNAVTWNAKMIFSVPCCQHELNAQMQPRNMTIMSEYGILQERFCAIATDAIRGNILEAMGYKTQLLEFIDFAHTPKNILIRAIRRPITQKNLCQKKIAEVRQLMEEFSFSPTLYELFEDTINSL